MPITLRILNALALLLYPAVRLYARLRPQRYGAGWPERFGFVAPRMSGGPCVWIHAVSLGEVNATRTLVDEIARRCPQVDVVVSTTTQTGDEAARRAYPQRCVFRFPLDFPWVVRRAMDRIRPTVIVLMELEVWPNLIREASRRGIPVCIANGRVTLERSMRRFRHPLLRPIARWMFSRLEWVAAQDETYSARFRELGVAADRLHVVGTVKYDTASIADSVPGDVELAAAMGIARDRPVLVAGSTGPGEEEILLDAWQALRRSHPGLQLVIVPRKPERFDEVAQLITQRGFPCIRRSQPETRNPKPETRSAVFLGDTMGELRRFYSLATVVFVGRTLVPMGGSDVMEVAGLAKPIVVGPHTDNFTDAVAKLAEAGATARVADGDALVAAVDRWLAHPSEAAAAGRAGQEVVRKNTGATRRTVDLLCRTLERPCLTTASSAPSIPSRLISPT